MSKNNTHGGSSHSGSLWTFLPESKSLYNISKHSLQLLVSFRLDLKEQQFLHRSIPNKTCNLIWLYSISTLYHYKADLSLVECTRHLVVTMNEKNCTFWWVSDTVVLLIICCKHVGHYKETFSSNHWTPPLTFASLQWAVWLYMNWFLIIN